MKWFFDRLEKTEEEQTKLDSVPETVSYEERDGWLYVYKIKAVKQFDVAEF